MIQVSTGRGSRRCTARQDQLYSFHGYGLRHEVQCQIQTRFVRRLIHGQQREVNGKKINPRVTGPLAAIFAPHTPIR